MPPKRGKAKKTAKSKVTDKDGGARKLRPKKPTDFSRLNKEGTSERKTSKKNKLPEKAATEEDNVSIDAHSSDDDLDMDTSNGTSGKNTSNSATPDNDNVASDSEKNEHSEGDNPPVNKEKGADLSKQVAEMVGKCLKEYESRSRKKRSKRTKRRRYSDVSSSSEDTDYTSSQSSSEESTDSSVPRRRKSGRKRRRREHKKRKDGQRKKGERTHSHLASNEVDLPSQSTIYTRGCKSVDHISMPKRGNDTSETDSRNSGCINSDMNSDDFVSSLETSLHNSTPVADRRSRQDASAEKERDDRGNPEMIGDHDENNRREELGRDRADEVIRDIQRNKADLAKPTGEWSRQLETLLIDMKHFHLTSHVDRKLKASILEGDFTVDFRKLLPVSRSRCKTDSRLNMINEGGRPYFVPADRDSVKEITSYKQWEVAYRVFMGVMIGKWPEKADELLEYPHVIQTASLSYPWESVFNYDIAI